MYFPQKELKQAWIKATKGTRAWRVYRSSRLWHGFELVKYTLKNAERENGPEGVVYQILFEDPKVLDKFLSAVYGMRLIRTYGTFRRMELEDESEERDDEVCPDCGSACWVDLGPLSHAN